VRRHDYSGTFRRSRHLKILYPVVTDTQTGNVKAVQWLRQADPPSAASRSMPSLLMDRRAKTGREPMGPAAVQQRQPHEQPTTTKKSPAPLFHAATKRVRKDLYALYYGFLGVFRQASERWRSGDPTAISPDGCFPPPPRFIGG